MAEQSVIIVGAGIAGLSAGYELQKAGLDVRVLEANHYAGGCMATVEGECHRIDIGAKVESIPPLNPLWPGLTAKGCALQRGFAPVIWAPATSRSRKPR